MCGLRIDIEVGFLNNNINKMVLNFMELFLRKYLEM